MDIKIVQPLDPCRLTVMVCLKPFCEFLTTGKLTALILIFSVMSKTHLNHATGVQQGIIPLQKTAKDELIINIITDFLLWERLSTSLWYAINAVRNREELELEPERHYTGYTIAFRVMRIYGNDKLCGELSELLYDMMNANKRRNAIVLAEEIYAKWLNYIKKYTLKNVKN